MKTSRALLRKFSISLSAACCVASLFGCAAVSSKVVSTPDPVTPVVPASATYIYTVDFATSSIYAFPASSNALTTPTSTITPPAGFSAISVATDGSGNIYLAGTDVNANATVLTFAKGATGAATPTATLNTTNYIPKIQSITVDTTGRIYVVAVNAGPLVAVYAAGASGNAAPTRTITDTVNGNLDGLDAAVDATGNLYLTTFDTNSYTGAVAEYSSTANGTVTPTRIITNSTYIMFGIDVDSSDNVYVSADDLDTQTDGAILIFSSTANGAATPTTTITGTTTGISFGEGLRIDGDGTMFLMNEIPDANVPLGDGYTYNVLSFNSTATGNVAPTTTLTSAALGAPDDTLAIY